MFELLLKGGTVVNHDGKINVDVGISGGRIAALGQLNGSQADQVVDCTGLHILPGVIDTQVHFREPGAEHKEDLETGSRGAVMGGVTAVFEMPNTWPTTVTPEALADKVSRAHHRMYCDFAFYVGGTRENIDELPMLEKLPGAAGIKVFLGSSTGDLLIDDAKVLGELLKKLNRRAAFHSEDEGRLRERMDVRRVDDPTSHPEWRDVEAAMLSTRRLVRLAHEANAQIHVLHVSTAEEMEFLRDHKDIASVEVTPQHLTLAGPDIYHEIGTRAQMNPPLRDARHRDGLWAGLTSGVVDVLGSDHAPHTLEEKSASYPATPSGMPGVQTLVPIMLDHVNAGKLSLERFVDLMSHGPQRLFGLQGKGRLAVGYDADITVVDLKREMTLSDAQMESRSKWTPYDGRIVRGCPVGTIIRGNRVMWDGEILGAAQGEAVKFQFCEN